MSGSRCPRGKRSPSPQCSCLIQGAPETELHEPQSAPARGANAPPGPGPTAPEWVDSPSDGPINVRDDHLVVPVPQVDGALAAARALVLRGDTEHHVVRAVLQLQAFLKDRSSVSTGGRGPGGHVVSVPRETRSGLYFFFLITTPGHSTILSLPCSR